MSFSKTIKTARVRTTSVFFQIARETILLLINNIHEQNYAVTCVKSHLGILILNKRKLRNLKNKKLRNLN